MSVFNQVSPNTSEETGLIEHISRLWICRGTRAYSIHIKRKQNALSFLIKFGEL